MKKVLTASESFRGFQSNLSKVGTAVHDVDWSPAEYICPAGKIWVAGE